MFGVGVHLALVVYSYKLCPVLCRDFALLCRGPNMHALRHVALGLIYVSCVWRAPTYVLYVGPLLLCVALVWC